MKVDECDGRRMQLTRMSMSADECDGCWMQVTRASMTVDERDGRSVELIGCREGIGRDL